VPRTSYPITDGVAPAQPLIVVAVDGPSGSGKSSVCREVARRLGVSYLDTGAMYRAVCWSCLDRGMDLTDQSAVARHAAELDLLISMDPDRLRVTVNGVDVTAAIRSSEISMAVSEVARNLAVRAELARRQRQLILTDQAGCVAEGRDVTTVVAPDADVRILLTADPAARISRRAVELHGHESERLLRQTAAEVVGRDARDAEVVDFLRPGEGVLVIDTSHLDFEATVARVLAEIAPVLRRRRHGGAVLDLETPVGARGPA